ncbi:hypothetical protein BS50DRAFT_660612 [Corynespora cassiicola Philippines]|uniref:Uncharacterized protein n=1 Tax=Corynespora cassiicola Philippines TaxID=1448308 RepID=A0A2T2P178_CORCC|nr:hypothetical protein BS50DRAFT_660612 [Corynespora cassiicola Philippines]
MASHQGAMPIYSSSSPQDPRAQPISDFVASFEQLLESQKQARIIKEAEIRKRLAAPPFPGYTPAAQYTPPDPSAPLPELPPPATSPSSLPNPRQIIISELQRQAISRQRTRMENARKEARRASLRAHPHVLSRRFRDYNNEFRIPAGQRPEPYYMNLLANRPEPRQDDRSDVAVATRYAQERPYNFWTVRDTPFIVEMAKRGPLSEAEARKKGGVLVKWD